MLKVRDIFPITLGLITLGLTQDVFYAGLISRRVNYRNFEYFIKYDIQSLLPLTNQRVNGAVPHTPYMGVRT